jgi:hypothetical protein
MDRPASFTQVEHISAADDIARRSCADVLGERERPLVFFTPALLVTHGGFDRDPVIEFDSRFPAPSSDQRPFCVDLQREHEVFFSGLGLAHLPGRTKPVNWDKRLYCIDAERAEDCFAFIGGIAFSDPKTGFFASVFSYDMVIQDPTSTRFQTLSVKVFGIAASDFVAFLETRLVGPPKARRIKMPNASASIGFLRQRNIVTNLTDEDPLQMRD